MTTQPPANGESAQSPSTSLLGELSEGTILDERYQLQEAIGRGAVGVVWRALDLRLDRLVAVKVLSDASAAADEARFGAEARLLARFSHPNLVSILDAGKSQGRNFLVMELIDGTTLAARLKHGPLESGEAATIGSGVASALTYVHEHGTVHRDVKPANILLDRSGQAHLADFGIARLVDATGVTATGFSLGTPGYLAPEQVLASGVGPAADVFALGLVLLECLTGVRAYPGTASETTAARLAAPPTIPASLDRAWARTIAKMTALDPAARTSSSDLPAELGALSVAPPQGPLDDAARTAVFSSDRGGQTRPFAVPSPEKRPVRQPRRFRPLPVAVIAVVLSAFLIGLAFGGIFSGSPKPPHGTGALGTTHDNKTTTTTSTTTSTTTTVPPKTPTVAGSSTALVTALERGVADGQVTSPAAQALEGLLQPVVQASDSGTQVAQPFDQLALTAEQAMSSGQISGAAATAITRDLTRMATALGISLPSSTNPPGPGPGHHHGPGNGNGNGN